MSTERSKTAMHNPCTSYARSGVLRFLTRIKGAERLLTYFVATMLATASHAQDTFALPQGCEAFITVQGADCSVDHNFYCAGDPEGHKQRVSLDERGLTYVGTTDSATQWIRSFHPLSGHSERLADNPVDPASLTELIETGKDTYDFKTLSEEVGTTRYVGQDTLTGREVVIDDVSLAETEYSIAAFDADGTELWRSSGNEYISREWRMFLSGTATTVTPDGRFERNGAPKEFVFPSEDGFLSNKPKFGCGVVMSSFEVNP